VLVAARRFHDLSVTDDELARPRAIELRAVDRGGDAERRGSDDGPEAGRTVAV
jgi:DNA recombination protein RmuC